MTNTWLIEVEFEDGEVFTHRTHKNPHDAGWECVFPTAVAIRFSPVPVQERQSESVAARAEVGQGGAPFSPVLDSSVSSLSVQGQAFSFTELEAAQTALICVRQALLISQTTEDQCACMAAFAAQAQRVMQLSGRGASV